MNATPPRAAAPAKPILLLDLCEWRGHHGPYFIQILTILVGHGYQVFACSTNNAELRAHIHTKNLPNCTVLDWQLTLLDRIVLKCFIWFDALLTRLSRQIATYCQLASLTQLVITRRLLRSCPPNTRTFFADLGSVLPAVPPWLAQWAFPAHWVGLYIAPSYQTRRAAVRSNDLSPDALAKRRFFTEMHLGLASCRALLVLHPIYCRFFRHRFPQLTCLHLPELVNIHTAPQSDHAQAIARAAGERAIVGLFGPLNPVKNLPLFLEASHLLDKTRYFCVVVGYLPRDRYSTAELARIDASLADHDEHMAYISLDQLIPSEEELNLLLSICQVIFLHYRNHPYSSNFLAKALAMGKPVVVSPGYLSAHTLHAYSWQAVADHAPVAIAQAIAVARAFQPNPHEHQRFIHDHSFNRFEQAILAAAAT
jgi:glycosyltransferase involved in cell wall biosynthesis